MSGPLGSSQWMYASGYELEQSLKFEDGNDAYLSFTPAAAGNRRTWTWSGWVKRGNLTQSSLFATNGGGSDALYTRITFHDNDSLLVTGNNTVWKLTDGTQAFRDPAAWYHIVVALDTTDSTAANRLKIYVNGSILTQFSHNNAPDQNEELGINTAEQHHIGSGGNANSPTVELDGYLSEVHFIDGTALTPSSFGETGEYGEWKPIAYEGSYGTNGFYLPFKHDAPGDVSGDGFASVTYKGTSALHYIGGIGFKPDFLWVSRISDADNRVMHDSVRGVTKRLLSNLADQEATDSNIVASFENDGFVVGTDGYANYVSARYVAWCWDMGGSSANNTTGSTNSVVRANQSLGQSIVTYTGQSGAQTVGHGLSSAPTFIMAKNRSSGGQEWLVYHGSNTANPETDYLRLDTTAATADNTFWNDTAPTSSVFSVGDSQPINSGHGNDYVAYCFHDVTGYSKFGSYTGDGTTDGSHAITLGFTPAWVMIKCTNDAESWWIFDSARNPLGAGFQRRSAADTNGGEIVNIATGADNLTFTSDGFKLPGLGGGTNQNNNTYVYMAFADKREYAYWMDQSGNNNDWASNGMTESDIVLDTPSNNFPTLNPLSRPAFGDGDARTKATLTEGNLKFDTVASQTTYLAAAASFDLGSSGKWYAEFFAETVAGNGSLALGITFDYQLNWYYAHQPGETSPTWGYNSAGSVTNNNSAVSGTYASYTAGDIIQLAVDLDNDKFYVGKNNTWQEQDPANGNGISISTYAGQMCMITCGATNANQKAGVWNFGQDSSFAGRKVPQANGSYDFFYTPPTGYKALCTKELPAVIKPKENFNVVLWTASGSANQAITGVGFQPDLLWIKDRDGGNSHHLFDAVRGVNERIRSDSDAAEDNSNNSHTAFGADGFTLGAAGTGITVSGNKHVAWNWKANGSGSSNTTGDINSTVSANAAAGFSIVSYTGNGSANQTVGHGLSKAPEWILVKNRADTDNWCVFVNSSADTNLNNTSDATDFLRLDANIATGDDADRWNDTVPTTSVFTVDTDNQVNGSGNAMIAYCFHDVDGYAKVGAYRGTGNAAGAPFVHCGFRPAFIIIKQVSNAGDWYMYDKEREGYNPNNDPVTANYNNAEGTDNNIEILSNGFRLLNTNTEHNASGQRFFFYAVAEFPLKFANAK